MLRRLALVGLTAAAIVPFTSTPASAICTIYVPTGDLNNLFADSPGIPDVGPYNCNFCPLVERTVEKHTGDVIICWT